MLGEYFLRPTLLCHGHQVDTQYCKIVCIGGQFSDVKETGLTKFYYTALHYRGMTILTSLN